MDRFYRLQKYLTRRDDGLVRRTEVLFGSVRYPALQLLNRTILRIDSNDAGEVLSALGLAVEQPIIVFVAERAKGFLIHVVGAVSKAPIQPVFFRQRLFSPAIHPVPNRAVLVVDGDPHVPRVKLFRRVCFALRAVGSDLGEGHDKIVAANINLLLFQRSNGNVSVAEFCRFYVKYRSTARGR